jgi:hypothetical protein
MEASMVTIELPAQLYTQLQMLATDEQTDPIEILTRLITLAIQQRARPQSPTRAFQRILDRATDLGVTDLAEQHDHYLYGVEKR